MTLICEQSLKLWADEAVKIPVWAPTMFPPSRYYRFLQVLARELRPALSVELGVCGGGGSMHLAEGYPQGVVVGVDCSFDHPEQLNYIQSNYSNFTFWLGDSVADASKVYEKYGAASIVFVDTIHTKERTIEEFNAWLPYMATNGVICFDDLLRKEMGDFWNWLPGNKVRLDFLHPTSESGFGVFWK